MTNSNWVDNVETKWQPPEGTFAKDTPAKKTAEILAKASKDFKQAVARLNFYYNRCGDKCSEEKRKEILIQLRKIFGIKEFLKGEKK